MGNGREVSLDQCPRSKLQHQCIKYLGPVSLSPLFFLFLQTSCIASSVLFFSNSFFDKIDTKLTLKSWCSFTLQKERDAYEVIVEDGKLFYKDSRKLLDTTNGNDKYIFVLSTSKRLYVGQVNFHSCKISKYICIDFYFPREQKLKFIELKEQKQLYSCEFSSLLICFTL